MATLGIVGLVKDIDLSLQLGKVLGERPLLQPLEQSRMEPLILPLGRGPIRFAGDRGDAQAVGVGDQFAGDAPADWNQGIPVI